MHIIRPGHGGYGMGLRFMTDEAVIVFLKNPEEGKVKTRLAKTLGSRRALKIYQELLNKIRTSLSEVPSDIYLFYSERVENSNGWDFVKQRRVQKGDDIGSRMSDAFRQLFKEGYSSVVLIGTDIWDLQPADIRDAFYMLEQKDVVLGPAEDGGYYLIGMKTPMPELFELPEWSNEHVLERTLDKCRQYDLTAGRIRMLRDIDEAKDLEGTGLL